MKCLSISNLKGGTGKSNFCFNMAGIVSEGDVKKYSKKPKPKNILVIDADAQGNVTNNFAVDRLKKGMPTIVNVFENNIRAEEVIIPTQTPNVSIIAGSLNLTGTELRIINNAGREMILTNWLKDNEDFLKSKFNYIFFDTPPSFNIICQNVYIASDDIILINDVSMNSIEGSEQFCALWRAIRLQLRLADNVSGFVINNLDKRIGLSKDFSEYVKKHDEFKSMLFNTVVHNNVKLKESELQGKTINYFDRKSVGYEDYKNLEIEFYQRGILEW